jgi:LuxR family maltose regulon positive regulatory protein
LGTPGAATSNRSRGLFESKLQPPLVRDAVVPRPALIDRLARAQDVPVVSIVSPPGYGKTTLLAQWSASGDPRIAWLSVDEQDNDPQTLLTYAAAALDAVEPIDQDALGISQLGTTMVAANVVPRLTEAMARMKEPVSLVIDQVDALQNRECLDAVAELAVHMPRGSQLAMATRADPPLPLARLRNGRDVVELGIDDLAMDDTDARALLLAAGVAFPDDAADALIKRAEGWPAGLYIGALALNAGGRRDVGMPFSGDDRLMAEYLQAELLSRLGDDEVEFLTRTALLDRMTGSLCDAVLETKNSARRLEAFAASNLLLVPLDRRREWYRYHQLFRDLLRTELTRREPELLRTLHVRAAMWHEANGLPEVAARHARAADDPDRVARLLVAFAQPTFAAGRYTTVVDWLHWFEARDYVDRYPDLAVYGASIWALLGQPAAAERWAEAAERGRDTVLADGSTMQALIAQVRLQRCRGGPEQMRRDAHVAQAGLAPASSWRGLAFQGEAMAHVLEGDHEGADPLCAHAVDVALHCNAYPVATNALATRALIAMARDRWDDVEQLAKRALQVVEEANLGEYSTTPLVYTCLARVALHQGRIDQARDYVALAARQRPRLSYALPHVSTLTLLELARCYIALADPAGARAVLRECHDILMQCPNLGVIPAQVAELEEKLASMRVAVAGVSALTSAELRLMPLLATHLTFPEIGERLHVSRHTVKTQAISIYQKLGVSSRSEAIARMHEVGLLG